MNLDLTGKVALVTGSTKGIGREIAESLHREGCVIVLNARDTEELATVSREMGLDPDKHAIKGDVTRVNDCFRMVNDVLRHFGRLDILVCNVGSGRSVAPGDETSEEWERVLALNLWSTTNMVEAARQALAATKGTIICVSSICGIEMIPGAPVTYSVAKAALNAYVRGIARPLGKLGVRINAVAPGNILFEGSVWARKLRGISASFTGRAISSIRAGSLWPRARSGPRMMS